MCASNDFADLRALLDSWQLSEMFTYLQDEGINVDELQMMKPHHMAELLHNYKLGTRIRFEHHLDAWRRSINKPMQSAASAFASSPLDWAKPNARSPQQLKTPSKETAEPPRTETRATITNTIETNTVSTNTITPFALPSPTPQELLVEMPPLIQKPLIAESSDVSTDPLPMPKPSSFGKTTLTLEHILQASGTKAALLKRHYNKHNELTSSHRALLIHLIVSYFESNDYHLSLNMSHNLEREVLKMFPTERLSDYRTEKRGKIYVKFCNMKRYKRTSIKRKFDGGGGDGTNLTIATVEGCGGGTGGGSGGGGALENDDEYDNWINQHLGPVAGAGLLHQHLKLTSGSTPLLMEIKTEKPNDDGF